MPWDLLHIITKLELGGAQLATLHEVAHSRFADGRRYLAFGPGGLLDSEARKLDAVECIELLHLGRDLRMTTDLRAVLEIAALVRRLKRNRPFARLLVHTHSSKAGVVGRLGARLGGADRIVHSIHGFGHGHYGHGIVQQALLAAERMAGFVTDGFTADSQANFTQGERDRVLYHRPRRVVRCGVTLADYTSSPHDRKATRATLGIDTDAPVILTLACLKPQKAPLVWAEVAAAVVQQEPSAIFLLAGDGELRPEVEALIARRDLARNLRLLGWRRDVADLLHASDLFLLTSRWEGLPQAIIQAMAARLPVVATNVDGNAEAVAHGENGWLHATDDVDSMTASLLGLIRDPGRRLNMGARGAERCAPFSVEQMVGDLDEFYAAVAGVTRQRPAK